MVFIVRENAFNLDIFTVALALYSKIEAEFLENLFLQRTENGEENLLHQILM